MIRKVIDSNFLRRPELEAYLARSSSNMAVLTEFVLLEAQKKDAILTLERSMDILSRYTRQVIILRPSVELTGFHGRGAGLQKRLIDGRRSVAFSSLCRDIRDAAIGAEEARTRIEASAHVASAHYRSLADAAPTISALFQANLARFSSAEIRILRAGDARPPDVQRKFIELLFESAGDVVTGAGIRPRKWIDGEAINLPVVRYCLCMALLFIRWIEKGRQTDMSNERVANDVIDANIAAYSTYFDGILTSDMQLGRLAAEARYFIEQVGGYVAGRAAS